MRAACTGDPQLERSHHNCGTTLFYSLLETLIFVIVGLRDVAWTDDGQLLAVSATKGNLYCYLTKLPLLGDTNGTK